MSALPPVERQAANTVSLRRRVPESLKGGTVKPAPGSVKTPPRTTSNMPRADDLPENQTPNRPRQSFERKDPSPRQSLDAQQPRTSIDRIVPSPRQSLELERAALSPRQSLDRRDQSPRQSLEQERQGPQPRASLEQSRGRDSRQPNDGSSNTGGIPRRADGAATGAAEPVLSVRLSFIDGKFFNIGQGTSIAGDSTMQSNSSKSTVRSNGDQQRGQTGARAGTPSTDPLPEYADSGWSDADSDGAGEAQETSRALSPRSRWEDVGITMQQLKESSDGARNPMSMDADPPPKNLDRLTLSGLEIAYVHPRADRLRVLEEAARRIAEGAYSEEAFVSLSFTFMVALLRYAVSPGNPFETPPADVVRVVAAYLARWPTLHPVDKEVLWRHVRFEELEAEELREAVVAGAPRRLVMGELVRRLRGNQPGAANALGPTSPAYTNSSSRPASADSTVASSPSYPLPSLASAGYSPQMLPYPSMPGTTFAPPVFDSGSRPTGSFAAFIGQGPRGPTPVLRRTSSFDPPVGRQSSTSSNGTTTGRKRVTWDPELEARVWTVERRYSDDSSDDMDRNDDGDPGRDSSGGDEIDRYPEDGKELERR
ncbi:hypothetical protein M427DRAFT_155839 [Gonapodya prolifera JEL478]|uniref:Uncharacterized protein n=1 Tax=Gonapodya prolifera (strain JEL478) TaxID=1344416 RepID=A0A139AEB5_GONPJ|nr:hypothetical protein M427DRAFT_155839 [Gonapodya prolifera JEL478]|eukprot:KXS14763.1 hypothetical protein M427DRAFT_155839 [Gonapodya prolifera JEL478]